MGTCNFMSCHVMERFPTFAIRQRCPSTEMGFLALDTEKGRVIIYSITSHVHEDRCANIRDLIMEQNYESSK